MKNWHGGRRLLVLTVAASSALATVALAPAASAAPKPHVLPASKPGWVAKGKAVSSPAASAKIDFSVLLGFRNSAAAEAKLAAISTPGSASYGKWLTSSQFKADYAPASATTAAVQKWLVANKFAVRKTLTSGLLIEASGTTAQINSTFGAALTNFSYQGKVLRANASTLSLPASTPAAVVGAVRGIIGLDQASSLKKPAETLPGPPPGSRYGVQPCSAYYGEKDAVTEPSVRGSKQPYAVCGYTPKQFESAYGESALISAGKDGRGTTVAITDAYAAPTIARDLATYSKRYGLPQMKKGQFTQILPSTYTDVDYCDAQGWYGEETLDVEAVHAMAPGAKIVYVGGSSCLGGLDEAWAETIDNHVADVITNSWTDGTDDIALLGESYVDYYLEFSLEAALTGITVNFSSGDSGDHTAGGKDLSAKTVEFPADVPFVTAVGGTSIEIYRDGRRRAEYGWSNAYSLLSANGKAWGPAAYSSGGGGGTSVLFAQPFYQAGVVPSSMSKYYSSQPARTVPDIAMAADPNTGFRVGETQSFPDGTYYDEYRIGGTSLASPLLAGVIAVANQVAGHPLGFINPILYKLAGTRALFDTVAPKPPVYQVRTDYVNYLDPSEGYLFKLQTIDVQTSTLKDVRGYDTETGVGAPAGPVFFQAMANYRYPTP